MDAGAFHWFDFTVLVRDLDPQAHMANHVYIAYLSEARARFMRERDPGGGVLRPSVVADVHLRYVSSLLAMESFRIGVRVTRIGRSSIGFGYRFEGADGRLVAEGDSVEVLVDTVTRQPRPVSAAGRAALGLPGDPVAV